MKIESVRVLAAMILIFGHLAAVALVFFHLHSYFRDVTEKLEIVFILTPITGLLAAASLKYVLANSVRVVAKNNTEPEISSDAFAVTTIGLSTLFVAFIIYLIASYPFGIASDPTSLRMSISMGEIALGGMLGLVVEKLFSVNLAELRKELADQLEK